MEYYEAILQDIKLKFSELLPQGWQIEVDQSSRRTYFYNGLTGETSWTLPSGSGAAGSEKDSTIAKLENEIASLKKDKSKNKAEGKANLKENALKAEINQMKVEMRQLKKDATEYEKKYTTKSEELNQEITTINLKLEEEMQKLMIDHIEYTKNLMGCVTRRDLGHAVELSNSLRRMEKEEIHQTVEDTIRILVAEHDANESLISSLRSEVVELQVALKSEKELRENENKTIKETLILRDQQLLEANEEISKYDGIISDMEQRMRDMEIQHQDDLDRARKVDRNTIAILEAKLEFEYNKYKEAMRTIATVWPPGMPAPSVLHRDLKQLVNEDVDSMQQKAQAQMRVGSQVNAWDEVSQNYFEATVTAVSDTGIEIIWNNESAVEPLWVAPNYCVAIVTDSPHEQKSIQTQTEVTFFDKIARISGPRSARARLDESKEEIEKQTRKALYEKTRDDLESVMSKKTHETAKKLFKLLDIHKNGEIEFHDVWGALVTSAEVRTFVEEHQILEPLRRKVYLVMGWKKAVDEITMPVALDEFQQICDNVVALANRDKKSRSSEPIVHTVSVVASLSETNEDLPSEVVDSKDEGELLMPWLPQTQMDLARDVTEAHQSRTSLLEALERAYADELEKVQSKYEHAKSSAEKLDSQSSLTSDQQIHYKNLLDEVIVDGIQKIAQLVKCGADATASQFVDESVTYESWLRNGKWDEVEKKVQYFTNLIQTKIQKLENEADASDMTSSSSIRSLKSKIDQLAQGMKEFETFKSSIESHKNNLRKIQEASKEHSAVLQSAKLEETMWNNELASERVQYEGVQECVKMMNACHDHLIEEVVQANQALQSIIEQRELLRSRLLFAKLQLDTASTDLERQIASENLGATSANYDSNYSKLDLLWQEEITARELALQQQVAHANQDMLRLEAAVAAIAERRQFRNIIEKQDGKDNESILALRELALARENAWIEETIMIVKGFNGKWIQDQERKRFQQQVVLLGNQSKESKTHYETMAHEVQAELSRFKKKYEQLNARYHSQEAMYSKELETLTRVSEESVKLIHAELDAQVAKHDILEKQSREQIGMCQEDVLSTKVLAHDMIEGMKQRLLDNRHWIQILREQCETLKTEVNTLHAQRLADLRNNARKLDETRQELEAMTQHASRLDNWVNSLKCEVTMLKDDLQENQIATKQLVIEHDKKQRWLKWEVWKREETARVIGTNVDFCFLYFAETVARLAGASKEHNERIAANGGISILLGLLEGHRPELKVLALKALSSVVIDAHTDIRTINHQCAANWKKWVHSVSVLSTLQWKQKSKLDVRLVAPDETMRLQNGAPQIVPMEMADSEYHVNMENQELVGRGLRESVSGVQKFVQILEESTNADELIYAAKVLSVLVLEVENRYRLNEVSNFMECILEHIRESQHRSAVPDAPEVEEHTDVTTIVNAVYSELEDEEVNEIVAYLLKMLCNLLYQDVIAQEKFGQCGGMVTIVDICRKEENVDVIQSCVSVLLNATSLSIPNTKRLEDADGPRVLLKVCDAKYVHEAMDEAGEHIQYDILQTLINTTRNPDVANIATVANVNIDVFVKMCLAESPMVRKTAALMIANIAQKDSARASLGKEGCVEVLCVMCENKDAECRMNALKALANLAWNSRNQDSIGKHLPQLVELCNDYEDEVRVQAANVIANSMFYHEGNRKRFGNHTKCLTTLVRLISDNKQPIKVHDNAIRAIGNASYNDAVALQFGILGAIPTIVKLSTSEDPGIQRTAAFALGNLAVQDVHKRAIVQADGVEAMTKLCGSDSPETVKQATRVLDILADMSRPEEIEARRKKFGIKGLVELCQEEGNGAANPQAGKAMISEPAVKALACDEMSIEASKSPEKQLEIIRFDGPNVIVGLLQKSMDFGNLAEIRKLQQRAMWALRAIVSGNPKSQSICGTDVVVDTIVQMMSSHYRNIGVEDASNLLDEGMDVNLVHSADVCEAAVSVLFKLAENHEANSKMILKRGLDSILKVADFLKTYAKDDESCNRVYENIVQFLEILGPYSWIECGNCKHQERGGTCCSQCGHPL